MNKKTFNNLIMPKPIILIIFILLFLYALMCINFDFQIGAKEFIIRFYRQLNTFLIQVPFIILLIISSYSKFYNEMTMVRFESQIKLFKAEITIAFLISIIYVSMIVLLEMIFIILTSGIPNQSFIFNFLISVCIQTLTVFFIISLYIMLRKISRNDMISIIIMIIVLGIDTYTTVVRTPLIPYSFNIFISPMCCLSEYLLLQESISFYYYLCFSALKVAVVITTTYLYIWITRSDYVAQK